MHPLFDPIATIFPPQLLPKVLLVGGGVRDWLMGKAGNDLDLAGYLSADELQSLGFRPLTPVSSRPVHFLHRPGLGVVEFTPLETAADLQADLERRDFSVNAMAMGMDGEITDPAGGRDDLQARRLRPCSDRCFLDDPLRIFRGLRFETDGWRLTAEAEVLIQQRNWEPLLAALPPERIGNELRRALAGKDPARFFQRMVELQVGSGILPELFRMAAVPAGPLAYHPEGNLLRHSLETLERLTPMTDDPLARFCALFHDLGKLATPPEEYPRHIGHDRAGSDWAPSFCRRLRLPSSWGRALAATSRLHLAAGRWIELRPGTRLSLAETALRGGIAPFLPLLVVADRGPCLPEDEWRQALAAATASPDEAGMDPALLSGPGALPPEERSRRLRQARIALLKQQGRQRQLPAPQTSEGSE